MGIAHRNGWIKNNLGIIAEAFTLRSLSALLRNLLPLQATNFRCTRVNVVPKPEEMSSSRRYSKLAFFKAVDGLEALLSHQCTNHHQHLSSSHQCCNRTRTGLSLEILTAITSNGDTIQQTKMATPLNNGQTVINSLWCMTLSIHLPLIVQGGKLNIIQTLRL